MSYYVSDEGVHVSLSPFLIGGNWGGDAEGDTLFSIENLSGSKYDDELYGNNQANLLWGNEGNDVFNGGGGGDHIYGGDGIDTVSYEASPEGVSVWFEQRLRLGRRCRRRPARQHREPRRLRSRGRLSGATIATTWIHGLAGENPSLRLWGWYARPVGWAVTRDSLDGG